RRARSRRARGSGAARSHRRAGRERWGERRRRMILEVAVLDVRPGQGAEFEAAFREAQSIIASMPGYLRHELRHCVEREDRYLLLVEWETLEAHTVGFRRSAEYQRWKELLHHFYDPFPVVEHYTRVV